MSAPRIQTVLVVEDEPLQRLNLMEMVEAAGYAVLEAADADQALAILETRPDIQLMIADIDMPGSMDGMCLAAAVRDRWPPMAIIITTGGRPPPLDAIPARAVFLPKPLNEGRVRAALRRFAA